MKRIDLIQAGGFAPGTNLVVSQVPVPKPAAGQVLIDIKASAINPVDWKMAEYGFLMPTPTADAPVGLGCDIAGIVNDADDASWIGKRVVAYLGAHKLPLDPTDRSAYAEQVLVDAEVVFEIPKDTTTFAQAASLPVGGLTAQLLLDAVQESVVDWVLVWGASSSVGFNAVQLAAKQGWKVIAVASAKHKDKLLQVGATSVVDYRQDNVLETVKSVLSGDSSDTKKATLGGVVDCIGDTTVQENGLKLLSECGDSQAPKVLSSVSGMGLPQAPEGVTIKPIELATALDTPEKRVFVKKHFPTVLEVEPQAIRSVKGDYTAETVQSAFQINKDGVSGEKVIIEWTP